MVKNLKIMSDNSLRQRHIRMEPTGVQRGDVFIQRVQKSYGHTI